MIESAIVVGVFGLTAELVFTAAFSGDRLLRGYTTLWVLPLYALLGASQWVLGDGWAPWILRAVFYASVILVAEYLAAWLLERQLGEAPWRYEVGYHLRHRIRLDYFPLWAVFALVTERLAVL